MTCWTWACLAVCALCLAVLSALAGLFSSGLVPPKVEIHNRMSLEWYLDERSHTGDLVFFKSKVDWVHRLVSPMTHVAMVVMHPVTGEPLVAEIHAADAVKGECAGVHCYPARQRLLEFDGELFVVPIAKARNGAHALALVQSLADVEYTHKVRMHVAKCKLSPWYAHPQSMMCSEFVLYLLNAMGVVSREWRCVTPSELLHAVQCSDAYQAPYALE